jgi:ABC-type uncharacterized transport system permease subunit
VSARQRDKRTASLINNLALPALAVFTGLVVGGVIIALANDAVIAAWGSVFRNPLGPIIASWDAVIQAYGALFAGALGSPANIIAGFQTYFATGQPQELYNAIYPYSIVGLPAYIHLPLAILGGALAGAIWGAIPGFLKARFGAHEVVNTIMMNWIMFRLSDWLLNGPMKSVGYRPVTPTVELTAQLPRFFPDPLRFNWGFVLALVFAALLYWFLYRTTLGFEIRAVGANPDAAQYAGMSVMRNFVLVMTISGALAGMAGACQVLGVDHWVGQGFSAGFGFDSIALALLGKSHPLGVVLAALLFGILRGGATSMQSLARIPIYIVSVIQGVVIIFVAAPSVIRWIYRLRVGVGEQAVLTRGWGK